jgi:endogenous inhibitor of DNA gyrase (YacG/DUF329 family)
MERNPFRPFCSERCKLLDLGNWLSGAYSIPGTDTSNEDNGSPAPDKDSNEE